MSPPPQAVTVELFGLPRLRAGRAELVCQATTLRQAVEALEAACPSIGQLRDPLGRLAPQYLISIDGLAFAADLDQSLSPGSHVLLLAADAGG